MFNAQQYLGDVGIPFWTTGKNVSDGWTSVQCPFCGDRSNHGAFSPNGYTFSCFKCGIKTHSINYIFAVFNYSKSKAWEEFNKYNSSLQVVHKSSNTRAAKVEWSADTESVLPSIHAQYIKRRKYDVKFIREMFDVRAEYHTGFFKYRLVIPVYMNHRLMTFVGRDVTGKSGLPYKNFPEEQSVLPAKECVYNIDNVHDTAIIFEGIFDCWRFVHNSVALFGLVYTKEQVRILAHKLKKAIICFDNEPQAIEVAEKLAFDLSMHGLEVELLLIDAADPGEMSQEEAEEVKQELFGVL